MEAAAAWRRQSRQWSFPPSAGIACPPPASGLISDFTLMRRRRRARRGIAQARFGDDCTTLWRREHLRQTPGTIASNVAGGDWHITGNVANYAGFSLLRRHPRQQHALQHGRRLGLHRDPFTIWGTTAGNPITHGSGDRRRHPDAVLVHLGRRDRQHDADPAEAASPTANGMQYYHPGCADPRPPPSASRPAPTPRRTRRPSASKWDGLHERRVQAQRHPQPDRLRRLAIRLGDRETPYAVDIHIDNLTFTK